MAKNKTKKMAVNKTMEKTDMANKKIKNRMQKVKELNHLKPHTISHLISSRYRMSHITTQIKIHNTIWMVVMIS